MGNRAIAHRKVSARKAEPRRSVLEEQFAHLGAGQAQRSAAELDRLAARGVAFIGRQIGVTGLQ